MKHFLRLSLIGGIFAIITAAPIGDNSNEAKLIDSENVMNPDGSYYYKYNLDNGAMQQVEGKLKNINEAQVYMVVGSYEHPADNGLTWVVDYIADETGYHAMVSLRGSSIRSSSITERPPDDDAAAARNMARFLREFHKRYFRRKFLIF